MKYSTIFLCFLLFSGLAHADEKKADQAFSDKNYKLAFKLHMEEAEKGNISSQFMIAVMYQDGLGITPDLEKSNTWLKKSAKKNHRPSLYGLGVNYLYGYGVEQNTQKAIELLKRGHDLDDPPSSEALARIYIYGEGGLKKDFEKAKPYLMHTVEEGMPNGLYLLAHMYLRGIGYQKDEYKGSVLLVEAANNGMKQAQKEIKDIENKIGMSYETYLKEAFRNTIPLNAIKVCPSSSIERHNCTISWDD